jgi:hypothetical protein
MRIRSLPLGATLAAAILSGSAAAEGPEAKLIEMRASTVVTVKAALKISGSFGGRSIDQEREMTASGVVVDSCGFVMMNSDAISLPRFARMGNQQHDLKFTPTNLRVVFAGDETEYEAILGATDSKLGLAFVLIRDLKGRTATAIDLNNTTEPKVGDTLYAVTRLEQGFDYAPVCEAARIIGHVAKPRSMWAIGGDGGETPHPLYTADGAVAGIVIIQEGVGDDRAGFRQFLLPLKIASGTIERALKTSKDALEEANKAPPEEAKPAEEKPAEEKPAEEKPAEEKPAEGGK